MKHRPFHVPLTLLAAAMIIVVASLTGSSLWVLRRLQRQSVRDVAARTVQKRGQIVTGYLSRQPVLRGEEGAPRDWASFDRLFRSFCTMEPSLQYVSVSTSDGVTLFHRQGGVVDPANSQEARQMLEAAGRVGLEPKMLRTPAGPVPVVVFTATVEGADGTARVVEVGIEKDAVERKEQDAAAAIGAMFKVSLLAVIVAFAICALLVVWIMRREMWREKLRRDEEHLAFSGVLANGIAHDFRNPMSSVKLDSQMLEREVTREQPPDTEKVARLARRLRTTVDRMDGIFHGFLFMSRPQHDRATQFSLNALLDATLTMLHPRMEDGAVTAEKDFPEEEILVVGHEPALRRAVTNILLNAVQFAGRDGTVRVSLKREGEEVVVRVVDTGPGIPKRKRKAVFDMFTSTRPEGTGLGLFLARAAVEKCGGTIAVEDREGPGTSVRITLPTAQTGSSQ